MNIDQITLQLSQELNFPKSSIQACLKLLTDDCTIPFIARYRKELTGNLDEVAITTIRDSYRSLVELEKRRQAIMEAIAKQGKLTPDLETAIGCAKTMPELEDIYLPYKLKRRTRAQIAIEQGLRGLADALLSGAGSDPLVLAANYLQPEKGIDNVEAALQGARDIIAEQASEIPAIREEIRTLYRNDGIFRSKAARGAKIDDSTFRDYHDFSEPLHHIPSHRILALLRGEEAKELSLKIEIPVEFAQAIIERQFFKSLGRSSPAVREHIKIALADGLERLIQPSLETELRNELKLNADKDAIQVFANNLREVLMGAPLGTVPVLALDPGFRTGCKLAVLNAQGVLLHHQTIYPLEPHKKVEEATQAIRSLVNRFAIQAIAIGNGTGGRETLAFCTNLKLGTAVKVCLVNESGASIYSASEIARTEFPDLDLTVRGAVSIGRRLMDPLAELVKIDPKSIGVGQYQHDVDQKALKTALDETIASCVNAVGVDLNSASPDLLQHVSGLNGRTAQAIIHFRTAKGAFHNRRQLLEVPGLGPKSFEQAAGFLRINGGDEALDSSAVHPESYQTVYQMAKDSGIAVAELLRNQAAIEKIKERSQLYSRQGQGVSILDLLTELARPGRDPRPNFESFSYDENIHTIEDVREGMVLPGIVTNVAAFGAFIDIGIHEQGLAHISQLSDSFVRDPHLVVKPGQPVQARVIGVDLARKRVSLSLKGIPDN